MAESRIDWVEIQDPRTGDPMFANTKTGECLWEAPQSVKVKKSSTDQWWELYDDKTRRYYYYNAHTKQTEWRKPKDSDIITLAKLQKGKGSKRRSSSGRKDGSQRRRSSGTSSSRRESSESRSHRDTGSMPRKYSRHSSKESLTQLRKHSKSSGHSRQSKGHSSKDEPSSPLNNDKDAEMEHDSTRSSVELKENEETVEKQSTNDRKLSNKNYSDCVMPVDDEDLTSDMDMGASFQDMENTARNISYLKISGEITDEPESYDILSDQLSTEDASAGRTSNCSVNQTNYVSDGPLSESESSALNDSFHSCGSKCEDSEGKLDALLTEAEAKNCDEIPRTTSFFNKMVDEKGNLKPLTKPKLRHTSDTTTATSSSSSLTGAVLRSERSGRRRSNSMDNNVYDNVSYSVYDNLSTASHERDQDSGHEGEEDDVSLSEKLTSGGMPAMTAALVEACDPTESEKSPSKSLNNQEKSLSRTRFSKHGEENGGLGSQLIVYKPVRPPPPLLQPSPQRQTKPMTRSNTCPTSPQRTPTASTPKLPEMRKFTECDVIEQKRGLFGKKEMLSHSKVPLKKPVITSSDKKNKKEAIEMFKLVLAYMRDKPIRNKDDNVVLTEIVTKAWSNPSLRDELYLQLVKQTTGNNSSESLKLGWELFAVCLAMFPPSTKYHSYLEGYVSRHLKENDRPKNTILEHELTNQIAYYAENCHHKLEKMSKTGSRKGQRQPTQVEIETAKKAIFHPSMFGSTLEDIMEMQATKFPDRRLPWILTCLTEQIINHNGAYTEGIFRVPGDIDQVNALKVNTDNWLYPDDMNDPNVAASLLKQWFRDLREPLIDEYTYEKCVASCEDETVSRAIISSLPKLHQLILCYIIRFLQIFCNTQVIEVTKMDVNNLAMVWAPNFLRCPSNEPQVIFENTRKEMTFVRTLLNTFDTSFMEGVK